MPTISMDFPETKFTQQALSPPMTPPSLSPKIVRKSFSEPSSPSLKAPRPVIPPSPYNPLLTPSFRHNPPRLPSDQPWRYPSPSHPLHSKDRELCLGMVVRGEASPSTKVVSVLDSSPAGTLLRTPAAFHKAAGIALNSDSTEHIDSSPSILRPSLFSPGPSPFSSSSDLIDAYRPRVDESPLSRLMRRKNHARSKSTLSSFSEVGDWFSSDASTSGLVRVVSGDHHHHGLRTPIRLEGEDPFAGMYNSWVKESKSFTAQKEVGGEGGIGRIVEFASPGNESPVLRSSQLQGQQCVPGAGSSSNPNLVGLGIGLIQPFTFPNNAFFQTTGEDDDDDDDDDADDTNDADFNLAYPPSPEEKYSLANGNGSNTSWPTSQQPALRTFALRRAHTVMIGTGTEAGMNAHNEQHESMSPPLKRRRTVDSCN